MAEANNNSGVGYSLVFERTAPRLFDKFPNLYFLFWATVCAVPVVVSIYFAESISNTRSYLGLCLALALGLLTVPLAFKFCHWKMTEWAEGIDSFVVTDAGKPSEWFLNELTFFRGSVPMYLAGAAMAAVALLAFFLAAFFYGDYLTGYSRPATVFGYSVIMISGVFAGFGVFAVYCGSRAVWRLGKRYPVRVEPHKFGILSTGRMLLECYFAIAMTWSFYVLSAVLGRTEIEFEGILKDLPMLLLAVPTFIIILGSFILCQTPLHKRMVKFKRDELLKIEKILQRLEPRFPTELNEGVRNNIEFLQRRRAAILSLPEWPFGLKLLIGAITSSVAPILPVLVNIFPTLYLVTFINFLINLRDF